MSTKPIFVATHPRACSTAFERVFMTCRNTLSCVHEPFGDAWYFGPERLSPRYASDDLAKNARARAGFDDFTYQNVFESMESRQAKEGKRLFIKDMAQYWMPLGGKAASTAPSLVQYRRGVGTKNEDLSHWDDVENPTVVPDQLLRKYHFAFLIRHPRSSIPSYYRCTIPPLSELTDFQHFDPQEAGYKELRGLFDYLTKIGHIGPKVAGNNDLTHPTNLHCPNGVNGKTSSDHFEICVLDADDLLDDPYGAIEAVCKSVGVEYSPDMLKWGDEETQKQAAEAFEKWRGFHEDALGSTELLPRKHKKTPKSDEELFAEWKEKYGKKEAQMIQTTVNENVADYEYLKQFALKW